VNEEKKTTYTAEEALALVMSAIEVDGAEVCVSQHPQSPVFVMKITYPSGDVSSCVGDNLSTCMATAVLQHTNAQKDGG